MTPILGIWASAAQAANTGTFVSLATTTLSGSSTSSVTFSSISQSFTHLQVRAITRGTENAATLGGPQLRFNSDSGSNYANHRFGTYGTGTFADAEASQTQASGIAWMAGGSSTANTYGVFIMNILDYTNTNKYKTVRTLSGVDTNAGGGWSAVTSNLWLSTSAITSIEFFINSPHYFASGTQFALYGIKAA